MRFFRRSGSGIIVRDGNGVARFIQGPDPEAREPGGILAYDTDDPQQARFAEQYANSPGWYEVDKDGNALLPAPQAEPEPAGGTPPAESKPAWMTSTTTGEHIDEPAAAG
jgi:hypothetical protein